MTARQYARIRNCSAPSENPSRCIEPSRIAGYKPYEWLLFFAQVPSFLPNAAFLAISDMALQLFHAQEPGKRRVYEAELQKSVEISQTMAKQLLQLDEEIDGLKQDLDK